MRYTIFFAKRRNERNLSIDLASCAPTALSPRWHKKVSPQYWSSVCVCLSLTALYLCRKLFLYYFIPQDTYYVFLYALWSVIIQGGGLFALSIYSSTLWSSPPLTRRFPSDEHANDLTGWLWPMKDNLPSSRDLAKSHSRTCSRHTHRKLIHMLPYVLLVHTHIPYIQIYHMLVYTHKYVIHIWICKNASRRMYDSMLLCDRQRDMEANCNVIASAGNVFLTQEKISRQPASYPACKHALTWQGAGGSIRVHVQVLLWLCRYGMISNRGAWRQQHGSSSVRMIRYILQAHTNDINDKETHGGIYIYIAVQQ